ncbi:hypothetical protein BX661DRAFT_63417 [Kickxella alabastrina]|uniref:uncharacterized protein n=1 Tax=Kickxella alabastrina TaxID=61397 RepID=UPI002220D411|nr:uncharacterized protein BX661DRAFT_63417 [Kickxella alabastrina]KAI7833608.1 hypothetical protein BX661DRAFT_63417 [Kickxella alabastrina]
MTTALTFYSLLFMRFSWMVSPRTTCCSPAMRQTRSPSWCSSAGILIITEVLPRFEEEC